MSPSDLYGLDRSQQYRWEMVVLVRVTRVVMLLVLAAAVVSLVIAMAGSTGGLEKVGLAALIAVCVAMGVGITSAATHLQKRIARR
jgi:hypothetical protein